MHGVHDMMLDQFLNGKYSSRFEDRAGWQLKFAFFPKKCNLTGKTIWLETAYKGTASWHGPGEPVYETRWHDKIEHLVWQLKRENR
jgi:hypothetical protein